MKLSKFPVTSPAGNEYRVTITPDQSIIYRGKLVVVVYVKRKGWISVIFPFKTVGEYLYTSDEGPPNYIAVASKIIRYHEAETERAAVIASEARKSAEQKRQAAAEFIAWNGIITEPNEEGANGSR